MKNIPYSYKNMPINGGGYVTGLEFSEKKGELFCRTDVGGCYYYKRDENRWLSLASHVSKQDKSESYPIALDICEDEKSISVISGVPKQLSKFSKYSVNEDKCSYSITANSFFNANTHGNYPGRGAGKRLVKDPFIKNRFYFASQNDGLFISEDNGKTFFPSNGIDKNDALTFVFCHPAVKGMVIVGSASFIDEGACSNLKSDDLAKGDVEPNCQESHSDNSDEATGLSLKYNGLLRYNTLKVSYDHGLSFKNLPYPKDCLSDDSDCPGPVPHRYSFDGKYLYITFVQTGRLKNKSMPKEYAKLIYSCDTGNITGGFVLRYEFDEKGAFSNYKNITPNDLKQLTTNSDSEINPCRYGFGGICACEAKSGLVVLTTLYRPFNERIYRSFDYGNSWEVILEGLDTGRFVPDTSYMKPFYNGDRNLLHWMSDIKINPVNYNEIWFNSGTGVFRCDNLTDRECIFTDCCYGLEETVHLQVHSPVLGNNKVIDIIGDLGGFAFKETDKECINSFDDGKNRYITCLNVVSSEEIEGAFIVTARGNWSGTTKGGLIVTKDDGKTFEHIAPKGELSEDILNSIKRIEAPNTNPGWVAMSQNCKNIVWSIAKTWSLMPSSLVICSTDGGHSFVSCNFHKSVNAADNKINDEVSIKVYADSVDSDYFYAITDNGELYVSHDKGINYQEFDILLPNGSSSLLPNGLSSLKYADSEVRTVPYEKGLFYLAAGEKGLYELRVDEEKAFLRKIENVDFAYSLGIGIAKNHSMKDKEKELYIVGKIGKEYGIFRAETKNAPCFEWERINNDFQHFGGINSIDGDKHEFGKLYLGCDGQGLIHGFEA
ncbi:MAG: hypothetical protein MJ113_05360 [Lachnospiraceae bacterium]|nr:hypothetical protein [Lachnospiraceae bacterium]